MSDVLQSTRSFGVDFRKNGFSAVLLSVESGSPRLIASFNHVKQLYMDDPLFKDAAIVSALPASQSLMRTLSTTLKRMRNVNETLPFLIEPLLPYPVEEALLDKMVLSKSKEGISLNVYTTEKTILRKHLDQMASLQLDPDTVATRPFALAAFASIFCKKSTPILIADLDEDETTLVLLEKGRIVNTTSSLPIDQSDKSRSEILRILYSLSRQATNCRPSILFTGKGSENSEFTEGILAELKLPSTAISEDALTLLAVPIGLAFIGLLGYKGPAINLRRQEFSKGGALKRIAKPAAIFTGLSIALALSLSLFTHSFKAQKEFSLQKKLVALVTDIGKPYPLFEQNYQEKKKFSSPPKAPEDLSIADIEDRLFTINAELKSTPDLFPLQPNTPYVSDLLLWLSRYAAGPGSAEGKAINLQTFRYQMVKRPDIQKKGEKYKIKVELEFASPNATLAREFHDTLLQDTQFVDTKEEIKWSTNRGLYKASFYLIDKTNYRNK